MSTKRKLSETHNNHPPMKKSLNEERPRKSENCGIIHSINLRNFMCHSRLTMRFTNSVNFIVGHNGSGKSAVLTGIIVGLGGKAISTSRGTSLKTLIKTGSNFAVIEITLRNNGDDPVKPEIYGDKIIVERKIMLDGSTSYKIKNCDGKVVSTKKEDLTNILDEINLQVDNPLTCLNQEMSKNFLHSKSENDKYKFFFKATQLEQMHHDYRYIQEQKVLIEKVLDNKQKAVPELEKEVLEKEVRFKNLATLQELKKKVETLKCELAWSHVAQLEHNIKPLKKELNRETLRTPKYDEALKKSLQAERQAQNHFDDIQKKVRDYQQQIKQLEPDKKNKKSAYDDARKRYKSTENELSRSKRQQLIAKKDKEKVIAKIHELKNFASKNLKEEKEKQETKLASLHDCLCDLQTNYKNISYQSEQFSLAVQQESQKLASLSSEESALYEEKTKLSKYIKSLTNNPGKKSKLQLFGQKMPEFVSKIEQSYSLQKFSQKPRGPIGSCITLKDKSLAVPVECAIRSLMHCFVVDNYSDEKHLEKLRNATFNEHERSRIVIYTMKFSNSFYDVSSGKVNHQTFCSVLDSLVIADPVVANFLIDIGHVEKLLVIPEAEEAIRTMQHGCAPRNCLKAYTKIGDEILTEAYYSNPSEPISRYLQADVQGEITRSQNKLQQLSQQLQSTLRDKNKVLLEFKSQQRQVAQYEAQKKNVMERIKNTKVELRELEAVEEPEPLYLKDLEDEVLNSNQQIASMDLVIQDLTAQMQALHKLQSDTKNACEEIYSKIKEIGDCAESLTEEIHQSSKCLEKTKADRAHFNEGKKKHSEMLQQLEKDLEIKNALIKKETEKATIIHKDKIPTRRTPTNLENEIKQINIRIANEETQHGEHERIVREYHEVREKFTNIKRHIRWSKRFLGQIDIYLDQRHEAFHHMRNVISLRCSLDFNTLLYQRGFIGTLKFNHEQEHLTLSVKPHENASQSSDLRALSGGERSFSTVCYVIALWEVMQSPLRCLDEFDVFMDMANRRVAMDMMVEMALNHKQKQFIFLTPHDISALPKSSRIRVWKMADPDRTQTVLPFLPE